jgi:hypothetical protein
MVLPVGVLVFQIAPEATVLFWPARFRKAIAVDFFLASVIALLWSSAADIMLPDASANTCSLTEDR